MRRKRRYSGRTNWCGCADIREAVPVCRPKDPPCHLHAVTNLNTEHIFNAMHLWNDWFCVLKTFSSVSVYREVGGTPKNHHSLNFSFKCFWSGFHYHLQNLLWHFLYLRLQFVWLSPMGLWQVNHCHGFKPLSVLNLPWFFLQTTNSYPTALRILWLTKPSVGPFLIFPSST